MGDQYKQIKREVPGASRLKSCLLKCPGQRCPYFRESSLRGSTVKSYFAISPNMITLLCVYRYQGHIGAALVLGGVDSTGPHLYTVHPHGSTDTLPYVSMGRMISCT